MTERVFSFDFIELVPFWFMKPMPFVYKNGAVVPIGEAKVSLASHSLQYGSTCYTGMRGYVRGDSVRLFRLRDHYARLVDAVKIMGWDCELSFEMFSKAIRTLIVANQPTSDFYIRPLILTESEELRLNYEPLKFDLAIYLVPFGSLFDPDRGLKLKISNWKRLSDDAIPTQAKAGGSYLNSCLAHTDAKRDGYDDALMLNAEGDLAELTGANVILMHQGKILTPPTGKGPLNGITLRSCVEILAAEGLIVEETPINRSMIHSADELIALGTAAQIQFAESVDGRKITTDGPGLIATLLRKRMDAILNREDKQFDHWVTEWPLKEGNHVIKIEKKQLA